MDSRMSNRIWSIVQASGDGGRVRAFIQHWLGRPKPKQYCAFVGGRSPFQHTLDRAARLCRRERIVTSSPASTSERRGPSSMDGQELRSCCSRGILRRQPASTCR